MDAQIAQAADKALALEMEIFEALYALRIRRASRTYPHGGKSALAGLDVMSALAQWAEDAKAVRPTINDSLEFHIENGRHPVVEAALKA